MNFTRAQSVALVLALVGCKPTPSITNGADSGSIAASSAPAPSVASVESAPRVVPTVAARCKGSDLDLDTAFNDFACLGANIGPPPYMHVTLTASPAEIAPGGTVEITITFANETNAPVGWGMTVLPGFDLFPISAKDVSGIYPCERGPQSNTPAPMVIVIDAHGKGHVKRKWVASRSTGACGPGVPLSPGVYELSFGTGAPSKVTPAMVRVK